MVFRILRRIRSDRGGTSGIEFALIAPVIILMFLGGVTMFDLVRSYQRMTEANSIVADMLSRQTSVDTAFLDKMGGFFTNLQMDKSAPGALRISSVLKKNKSFSVAWTKTSGTAALLPSQTLSTAVLPDISDGDSVLYVEGVISYTPLSQIFGLGSVKYSGSSVIRPRFIAAVAYTAN